jgi:hypothetical protein
VSDHIHFVDTQCHDACPYHATGYTVVARTNRYAHASDRVVEARRTINRVGSALLDVQGLVGRIYEDVDEYDDGLIAAVGCLSGANVLLKSLLEKARKDAEEREVMIKVAESLEPKPESDDDFDF